MKGAFRMGSLALLIVAGGVQGREVQAQEAVRFQATDGAAVQGYWYRTDRETPRAIVLAFHQGGANGRGEYGPIAPRLNDAGYDVLTIDQRRGGERWGFPNPTAAAAGELSYCEVASDLAGTLGFARQARPETPIILWGSSYSATLALGLAATNPDGVVGVLGFSPASGDPMAGCIAEEVSDRIEVPVLVLRPRREMEMESPQAQFERFRAQGHTTFVSDPGTHGSSMLVEGRVEGSVQGTWDVVMAFLDGLDTQPLATAAACATDRVEPLRGLVGTWDVVVLDRTTPGEYEESTARAVIEFGVRGCALREQTFGQRQNAPFETLSISTLNAGAPLERVWIDSGHGGVLYYHGELIGDTVRYEWERDLGNRRMISRHEYHSITPNGFVSEAHLSPDSGESWSLVRRAVYTARR